MPCGGPRTPAPRRRRGFTIKEVLIVVVIILICTSIAVQGYRSFHHNQSSASAANKMMRALSTARTFAMSGGTSHRVTIDNSTQSFWIDQTGNLPSDEVSPTPNTQTVFDPVLMMNIQVGLAKRVRPEKLPTDVIISDIRDVESTVDATFDLAYIIFRPDGSCRTNAVLQFVNQNDDLTNPANFHSIQVYAPTGAIEYFPNEQR